MNYAKKKRHAAQGYNGTTNLKISDKPITITLFYAYGGNGAPKGDMPLWKKVAEITNITMKNVANESITEEMQAFNTLLAGGELPDLIQGWRCSRRCPKSIAPSPPRS